VPQYGTLPCVHRHGTLLGHGDPTACAPVWDPRAYGTLKGPDGTLTLWDGMGPYSHCHRMGPNGKSLCMGPIARRLVWDPSAQLPLHGTLVGCTDMGPYSNRHPYGTLFIRTILH